MSKIFDAMNKVESPDSAGALAPLFEGIDSSRLPARAPATEAVAGSDEARVEASESGTLRVSALSPVFPLDDAHPEAAEQYRIIRTKLLHHALQPRVIEITSPSSGDGKTVTAVNTAACLALKDDCSVLLIDADLRRSSVADLLGLKAEPGLADVLAGRMSADAAIHEVREIPNLSILTAGGRVKNPAELLDSERWKELIEECRLRFRYVIVDTTPVAAVADYELVQFVCDGVVLVLRPDHTDRKLCTNALTIIPKGKLLGTVLNCVEDWFLWKGRRGYGYYGSKK